MLSAEKLAALVSSLGAIIWEADGRTFQFTFVSGQAEEILGYPVAEWLSDPNFWRNHTHPDDVDRCTRVCLDASSRGRDHSFEYRMIAADGRIVWLRDIVTVKRNPDGGPRLSGLMLDITRQKREEQRFRDMIEYAWDIVAIVTVDGRPHYVSPAVERILGYRPADLLGRAGLELVAPADRPRLEAYLREVLEEGPRGLRVRYQVRHSDGSLRELESVATRLEGSEQPLIVMNSRDITEQMRLEAQLAQSTKMEALGQLAGGVAHDFNNLLTVITGYTEMVHERLDPGDPHRRDIEEIRRAADRASVLTRQLLAFSRKQVLHTRVQDLNGIVRDMGNMIGRVIGETISLRLELSPQRVAVVGDRGQFEQMLLNLAVNGRDAMPFGGTLVMKTTIEEVDARHASRRPPMPPGRYACVSVQDSGTGMAPEVQRRIFEPFYTTKPPGKGTGLGLSTVYGIVQQSGGFIFLESGEGRGTTFLIYLPAVDTVPETAGEPMSEVPLGDETILLVEDEATVRTLAEQVLNRQGYRVLSAASGAEALEICRSFAEPIDLLVTDIVMSGMSGPELAARLEQARPEMAILYMSGYAGESILGAANEGGVAFLQKPFAPRALANKVRQVLDDRRVAAD